MKSLIVGMGEIGKSVFEVISRNDETLTYDTTYEERPSGTVDVLHVCFPYSGKFVEQVKEYIADYKPMHVVIWSTVKIGTTKKIPGAVHSPVEGRHPDLELSIRSMTRWIGTNNEGEGKFFDGYFRGMYLKTKVVYNTDFTEFLKLRSTSKFGINLVWADYEYQVAEELGMSGNLLREFDRDYNKLYHNLGQDWAQRYILKSPHGFIGGHCVRPNAELLNQQFPSELLDNIIAMDGARSSGEEKK